MKIEHPGASNAHSNHQSNQLIIRERAINAFLNPEPKETKMKKILGLLSYKYALFKWHINELLYNYRNSEFKITLTRVYIQRTDTTRDRAIRKMTNPYPSHF